MTEQDRQMICEMIQRIKIFKFYDLAWKVEDTVYLHMRY